MKLTVHDRGFFKHVFADNHQVGILIKNSMGWAFVCHGEKCHWVMSPLQLNKADGYGNDQAALLNITDRLKS